MKLRDTLFILLGVFLPYVSSYCEEGVGCSECDLILPNSECNTHERLAYYYCDNSTRLVLYSSSKYLICASHRMHLFDCSMDGSPAVFNPVTRECVNEEMLDNERRHFRRRNRRATTGSSRVGDVCAFNTDCQRGMYCGGGVCSCLSDFVAINSHCWQKVNPGESGCVESRQCQAVWPATSCSISGVCECPDDTIPSRTRDGTVCVSAHLPPACPLPEPHSETPNPATVLANPSSHPLQKDTYMPVLCTSTSSEVHSSNGGDGSTWCVYPDGDRDVYIADIYDCVSHPQVSHQVFPEYAESIDGICCPNRAYACIQPMESGPEPSVPRWWFNAATGTCVQFLWDPDTISGASPNNFRTIEHCESYCRDTCKRGTTEYTDGKYALLDDEPMTNCLNSNNKCGQDYTCNLIGSQQSCCPTTNHVCSAYGGRSYPSKPIDNFDRGHHVAGGKATTRYYYDPEQGRCINFMFYGLGNFNNFISKQDCESFCSKLVCENGSPLRIGEEWQRCETDAECPSSHSCQGGHKVCCPSSQTLCSQPKRLGDCTQSVRRYWYNAATRQCELFQYTGCQGNDNNFQNLLQCQQKCKGVGVEPRCPNGRAFRNRDGAFQPCSDKGVSRCPANHNCFFDGTTHGCCPSKAFTCSLNPDKGVQCGSGKSYRYYFNSQKQSCETFQYEGCDGNSNNFLSAEECQSYCGVGGCPNGGMPLRDQSSNRQMSCSELKQCPNTHECIAIPHSGNVEHRCCPTKMTICSQPPQQGNHCSKMSVTKYYFNIVTKECASFQFNGCNGNLNNFASASECYNFCSSAGCRVGEIAYKDVNTKRVFDCNNNLKNSCPNDFSCRHNGLTATYVCCGSSNMDVCPSEERAFVNPLDESIRECAINVAGSCPANFLCRFSPQKNKYYCCAPTTENVCPDGRALFRASKTLLPQRCTLNIANQCPDGYSCQSRSKDVLQGFCCSSRNVCKNNAEFLMDDKTKMPRICTPGSFVSCPNGYRCHRSHKSLSNGFCCKGEYASAVTEGCPPGEFAHVKKGEIVSCDPFNIENKGCPNTYTCQYAVAFQRYQCCGKDPIEEEEVEQLEQGCPAMQVAYTQQDIPVVCTASGNTCPIGYFCQFSDRNKQFQCCGHKGGCPKQTVAFIDITGSPMECNPTFATCPSGYGCIKSKAGKFTCCTAEITRRKIEPKMTTSESGTMMKNMSKLQPEPFETLGEKEDLKQENKDKVKECPSDMIMTNGVCKVRGSLGASCVLTSQCHSGAECIALFCACGKGKEELNGKCVKNKPKCTSNEVEVDGVCLPLGSLGHSCTVSQQCLNGTVCLGATCQCTDHSVGYEGRCLANLCGDSRTALASSMGTAIVCTSIPCPSNTQCIFSKTVRQYICCSRNSRMVEGKQVLPKQPVPVRRLLLNKPTTRRPVTATGTGNCPGGLPPLTIGVKRVPWTCLPSKGCPQGYSCIDRHCCPSQAFRGKREVVPTCPPDHKHIEILEDGVSISMCEPLCDGDRRSNAACPQQ